MNTRAWVYKAGTAVLLATLPIAPAAAASAASSTLIDSAWLVIAAALVFLMQAGFALLEGGSARSKNAVNVVMKNFTDVCFGSIAFVLIGYGLMFGTNASGLLGGDHFLLAGVEAPEYAMVIFQTMFAATAATIVSGAMAERTRFGGYVAASIAITALIYPVSGSWAWGSLYGGEGWLAGLGFIDFAGSSVVHAVGGWCALAGILVVGPRLGRFAQDGSPRELPGHNLLLVGLGGFILWFGWFGFNAGSTGGVDGRIGGIVLNTHLAASAGLVGGFATMLLLRRPLLLSTMINGCLGGLVSITAGAAAMTPPFAILSGLVGGVIVVVGSELLLRLRIDDVVNAVPVHAFCGVWGTLAAGAFQDGALFDSGQLVVQAVGCLAIFAWSFPMALLLFHLLAAIMGLRSESQHERRGLDISEHAEVGYPEFQDLAIQQRGA